MIDVARITVQAGNGGPGRVSFRRMKFMPKGGPDGGDGGDGGPVYLVGDKDMNTLQQFMGKQHYEATPGEMGGANNCHGKNGTDIEIKVPMGTVISFVKQGEDGKEERVRVCEILNHHQRVRIAQGGRGGLGNDHFKSSVNQAPDYAQPGIAGEAFSVLLELKLLANVGLVGFPNAGKSSLLASLTKARPEIANYPFTTLSPNLGVMLDETETRSLVLADIPGLIEGAGQGKGLGHEFLRHVERCSVMFMVLSLDDAVLFDDDMKTAEKVKTLVNKEIVLKKELGEYHEDLLKKPCVVCVNKIDIYDADLRKAIVKKFPQALLCSAATHEGLDVVRRTLFAMV